MAKSLHNIVKFGYPKESCYSKSYLHDGQLITANPYAMLITPLVRNVSWANDACPDHIANKYQELTRWPAAHKSDVLASMLPVGELPALIAKIAGRRGVKWFEQNTEAFAKTFGVTVDVQVYYWGFEWLAAKEISAIEITDGLNTLYVGQNVWQHDSKADDKED